MSPNRESSIMNESCPHCGETLPAVVDAFCPQCRMDLSETPDVKTLRADDATELPRRKNPTLFYLGIAGFIVFIINFAHDIMQAFR